MNVVLQSLLHNPLLRNYFLADAHNMATCVLASSLFVGSFGVVAGPRSQRDVRGENGMMQKQVCLGCNMDELYSQVFSGATAPFAPNHFLYAVWRFADHLAGYTMQDAHEFLVSVLDGIHGSCGGKGPCKSCLVGCLRSLGAHC